MIDKYDLVESLINQHFYYKSEYEKLIVEIEDIWQTTCGVKSPNLTGIHGTPEDKGSKILRIGADKVAPLENKKQIAELKLNNLAQQLHLYELSADEYEMLQLKYQFKMKEELIALNIGYSHKQGVNRKLKKMIEGMEKYV